MSKQYNFNLCFFLKKCSGWRKNTFLTAVSATQQGTSLSCLFILQFFFPASFLTKGGVGGKMLNEVGFMQWESSWIKPCNGRKMYDKSAVLITSQGNSRPSFTKNMFVILLMNASKRLILLLLHLSLCIWKILKSKFGLKWSKVSLLQPFFSISWCYL